MLPISTDASFAEPMSMLLACHQKVRRYARLCQRLAEHVAAQGANQEAAITASNILRYFNVAAPLHHQDEDEDLYPALLALQEPALGMAIAQLGQEHHLLAVYWQQLVPWLSQIAAGQVTAPPDVLDAFVRDYLAHADAEERMVYPAATRLAPATLAELGVRMQRRRGGV